MNIWKWIIAAAVAISLFSASFMYSSGASLAYSLASGAAVVVAVVVFLAAFSFPMLADLWLTAKVASGECCSSLAEAIWLRGAAKWRPFKTKQDAK